jgi:hypothetical protein
VIVRYGAGTSFFYKTISAGSTPCTNAVFGDPIPGTAKQCWYQGVPPPNSFVSVVADRRAGNRDKVDVTVVITTAGSDVSFYDSQSMTTRVKTGCATTCSTTFTLNSSLSAAGTITVSGVDFGTQTMSDGYPVR